MKLEKRLTEVTVSSLPVVGGGTTLGLAMRGGGGRRRGAGGRGVLVGPVGDWAGSYPRQGQATCGASVTALLGQKGFGKVLESLIKYGG